MAFQFKDGMKNGFLPFIVMFISMGLCMSIFNMSKYISSKKIQQEGEIAGEESNPTLGRLIWCILSFVFGIVLTVIAELLINKNKKRKEDEDLMKNDDEGKKNERLMLPWFIGITAGIMLWQSLGESVWHYGMEVKNDEDEKSFANFTRIESFQGIPMLTIFILIFLYGYRKLGFGVESCLGSFLGNWYGHVCMVGTYPFALACGIHMKMGTWYKLTGIINALIFGILGFYIIFFTKASKQLKYLSSICLYIAFGNILFSVIFVEE